MVKKHGIDPNVYETKSIFDDITKITGVQPSDLSAIAGGTATENTIAQTSQETDVGSNADDQDDVLSMLMRDAGERPADGGVGNAANMRITRRPPHRPARQRPHAAPARPSRARRD